jgi:hypothetical protein
VRDDTKKHTTPEQHVADCSNESALLKSWKSCDISVSICNLPKPHMVLPIIGVNATLNRHPPTAKEASYFAFRKGKLQIAKARSLSFCTEIPGLNPNPLTFMHI